MTTDTLATNAGAPVHDLAIIERSQDDETVLEKVARAFPMTVGEEQRWPKAERLIQQTAIYLMNCEDWARARILNCVRASLLDSLATIASYDLELRHGTNEVHLVPYANVCTASIGYQGFIKLVCRTGAVASVDAHCVYEGEPFKATGGDRVQIHHEIRLDVPRDDKHIIGVYAIFRHHKGEPTFVPMSKDEIERIRQSSKTKDKGPWKYWYGEMAKKSAIKRGAKLIPHETDNQYTQLLLDAIDTDNRQMGADERFTQLKEDHSRAMESRVAETFADPADEPDAGADDTGDEGRQPATRAHKEELLDDVRNRIEEAGGTIDAKPLILRICRDVLPHEDDTPQPIIETRADLKAVREALGQYDMATGDRVPDIENEADGEAEDSALEDADSDSDLFGGPVTTSATYPGD